MAGEDLKRRLALMVTVFVNAVFFTLLLVTLGVSRVGDFLTSSSPMRIIFIVILLIVTEVLLYGITYMILAEKNQDLESERLLEKSFAKDPILTVLPLDSICHEHKDFILDLRDIVEFSAVRNGKDNVTIFVKFNFEDYSRKLEVIPSKDFTRYYRVINKKVK